ncbi:hypothetical protein [Tumebacillus flagellatus]|uniref:Uncharacterized protein n=1 Tax=Tumebacillus flagellatus TaxID=1157490 RepID=A0A074LXG4_9BACL|nr:hypothetical protein [Tumebacillus flagellatus]KEO84808.1 hypothetical protein EL26_02010 [Tumebacillus flagellatus]
MSATARSRWWEWGNSLWMLWTLVPYLYSVAFLYIGVRTRQVKWLVSGLVYALPLADLLSWFTLSGGHWAYSLLAATGFGVCSILHALLVRREYLVRLSVLQERQTWDHHDLRNELEIRHGVNVRARQVAEENRKNAPKTVRGATNRVK